MAARYAQLKEAHSAGQHRRNGEPVYQPHSALGFVGRAVKAAGLLAPSIVGGFIKDAEQYWHKTRIPSLAIAPIWQRFCTRAVHQQRRFP